MVWEIPTQVRATVLCANSVYDLDHVTAEHGWAVWLETSAGRFLSDTGPGRPLLPNAGRFGISLANARAHLAQPPSRRPSGRPPRCHALDLPIVAGDSISVMPTPIYSKQVSVRMKASWSS
jgi:hypothetical protein